MLETLLLSLYTWTNITLPKISNFFNDTNYSQPPAFAQMFTYAFVYFLGSFFWGAMILTIGGGLYMKAQTALPAVVWFMISFVLCAILFPPDLVIYLGLTSGIIVGYLLFQIFVAKR